MSRPYCSCAHIVFIISFCRKSRIPAKEDEDTSEKFLVTTNEFLRKSVTLWLRDCHLPPLEGSIIRLPFELKLPHDAPPSFSFETYMNTAYVRYAVEVTGVRTSTTAVNRSVKFPIVVLQPDPIGRNVRTRLKLGWNDAWGRLRVESNMRKFPWGEYAHAKMEVCGRPCCSMRILLMALLPR